MARAMRVGRLKCGYRSGAGRSTRRLERMAQRAAPARRGRELPVFFGIGKTGVTGSAAPDQVGGGTRGYAGRSGEPSALTAQDLWLFSVCPLPTSMNPVLSGFSPVHPRRFLRSSSPSFVHDCPFPPLSISVRPTTHRSSHPSTPHSPPFSHYCSQSHIETPTPPSLPRPSPPSPPTIFSSSPFPTPRSPCAMLPFIQLSLFLSLFISPATTPSTFHSPPRCLLFALVPHPLFSAFLHRPYKLW